MDLSLHFLEQCAILPQLPPSSILALTSKQRSLWLWHQQPEWISHVAQVLSEVRCTATVKACSLKEISPMAPDPSSTVHLPCDLGWAADHSVG